MCSQETTDKIIKLSDHRSKYSMTFSNANQKKCVKHRVDGCLITDGRRCDHLLIDNNEVEYFVELKGKDVNHGCEQLERSIQVLAKNISEKRYSFIVSAAVPKVSTTILKMKDRFKRKYNSTLTIKNKHCEHCL